MRRSRRPPKRPADRPSPLAWLAQLLADLQLALQGPGAFRGPGG